MKNIVFYLLFGFSFFGSLTVVYSQCPSGPVLLNSQADLDNFLINYPDCTNINIGMRISGSVNNLQGLSNLLSINGTLEISGNQELVNLSGLSNLTSIGSLTISNNAALINLVGLDGLITIPQDVNIYYNSALISLDGIENLENVNRNLNLSHNQRLESLMGLQGLTHIGNDLFIENHNILTNLNGLENVQSIGGTLGIDVNFNLVNIEGISNIDPETINILQIANNYELSNCSVASVCEYIERNLGTITIEANNEGCARKQQVLDNCVLGIADTQLPEIKIFPNPTNGIFEISDLNEGTIEIFDNQGRIVKRINITDNFYSINDLSEGIYLLQITSQNNRIIKQLIKN